MRNLSWALPALLAASVAAAQERRATPLDPQARVSPAQFRSAFEGYRPFAEQDLADWRKANEEVAAAGGHAGQRPAQRSGEQPSKPQPGKPESAAHQGHHK